MVENSLKRKLRFVIRQMDFRDVTGYFRAIPGEHTEYALELSHTASESVLYNVIHNDCIAFSQLLQMKGIPYNALHFDEGKESGAFDNAYVDLKKDFIVVSFTGTNWKNAVRIPPCLHEGEMKTRAVMQRTEFLAEWIFLNGFSLQNKETGEAVHYVRFSGSASMTRNGKVMFVNAAYEPELSRRVTLGLEDNGCLPWAQGMIPSKWDAYKGLCLSDGYALAELKEKNAAPGAPELSAAGVVFVEDMKWDKLSIPASPCDVRPLTFDVKESESDANNVVISHAEHNDIERDMEEEREGAKLTDGVGLIVPEAGRWISQALCGNAETVSTFQIRLPFVKGMVHSVDFRSYLAEHHVTQIQDAWENRWNVENIWMILPLSMFKAHQWFGAQAELAGRGKSAAPVLYHEKLREYGHDLVITQRHIPKAERGEQAAEPFRLNYEVLQTSGMTEDEFHALLRRNLEQYAMLRLDKETRLSWLIGTNGDFAQPAENQDDSDTNSMDEDSQTADSMLDCADSGDSTDSSAFDDGDETEKAEEELPVAANSSNLRNILSKAVAKNRTLLYSRKAKDLLTDACNNLALRKILRGNLVLSEGAWGESRYLSCDLGRYLDYLVSLDVNRKHQDAPSRPDGSIDDELFCPLAPGDFCAPGFPAEGKYCALFRTPHYSRNEHLVLRCLPKESDPVRERWLGHLHGVVMVPPEGFAASRLGGADFDGDHVSIVYDKLFTGAVERSLGLNEIDITERNRCGGSGLPFIVIPDASRSSKRADEETDENVTIKTDGNTGKETGTLYNWDKALTPEKNYHKLVEMEFRAFRFSCENRVGIFSNYAFLHGAAAYGERHDEDAESKVQMLTALTGIEIDAAKTGKKPELPNGTKITGGVFLTLAQKAKRADKVSWSVLDNKNDNENKMDESTSCLLDWIPFKLREAQKNPESFLHSEKQSRRKEQFRFFPCFQFPVLEDTAFSSALVNDLADLYRAYHGICWRIAKQRKKRRQINYDNDLTRILWPRFVENGDHDGFSEMHKLCKEFFYHLNQEQKDSIRAALAESIPFEQTRNDPLQVRDAKLMDSLREAAGFDPVQVRGWDRVHEQLLNFDKNGFCLPYIMLMFSQITEERGTNPFTDELKNCMKQGELLEEVRKIAYRLCKSVFPEKSENTVQALLAAHLAKYADEGSDSDKSGSAGKEAFFWIVMGETALPFLTENPGEP